MQGHLVPLDPLALPATKEHRDSPDRQVQKVLKDRKDLLDQLEIPGLQDRKEIKDQSAHKVPQELQVRSEIQDKLEMLVHQEIQVNKDHLVLQDQTDNPAQLGRLDSPVQEVHLVLLEQQARQAIKVHKGL